MLDRLFQQTVPLILLFTFVPSRANNFQCERMSERSKQRQECETCSQTYKLLSIAESLCCWEGLLSSSIDSDNPQKLLVRADCCQVTTVNVGLNAKSVNDFDVDEVVKLYMGKRKRKIVRFTTFSSVYNCWLNLNVQSKQWKIYKTNAVA